MAQSYPWLSLADASSVLGIPEYQVLELAVSGRLYSRVKDASRELRAADVSEFASECAGQMAEVVAEHVSAPTVGRWSRASDPAAFEDRGDYTDTPSDEGDND